MLSSILDHSIVPVKAGRPPHGTPPTSSTFCMTCMQNLERVAETRASSSELA